MGNTTGNDTTFFCHDGHTLFYPTAPGRIYAITFVALADSTGEPSDFADSTAIVDVHGLLVHASKGVAEARNLAPYSARSPLVLPVNGPPPLDIIAPDVVEAWADWCDRDSETLDLLDGMPGSVADAVAVKSATPARVASAVA